MRQHAHVLAYRYAQIVSCLRNIHEAKFDKVVAGARSTYLLIRFFELIFQERHGPEFITFEYGVGQPLATLEAPAAAKPGIIEQNFPQLLGALDEVFGRQVEYRQGHPAPDIHAHGVGNHGVISGQHPADGQAIAMVSIGHEGTGHGHGQFHGRFHLLNCARLNVLGTKRSVGLTLYQSNVPRRSR